MTIAWNGNNWEQFKNSIPTYIKYGTVGMIPETNEIHLFTNIGIVNCKIGQYLVFPPKDSIKFYKSSL